jgi:hypothetical protein
VAQEVTHRLVALVHERGHTPTLHIWSKEQHLQRMRESGHFRFTREMLLHSVAHGGATRFHAMMHTNAFSQQFEFTDEEIGFDRLAQAASQYIGSEPIPWYISYRVRIGG